MCLKTAVGAHGFVSTRSLYQKSLVFDATVLWDGGNPDLPWGELDCVAVGVAEDDLAGLRSFGPGAFDGVAVLKDGGGTSADGSDGFVITV